LQISGTDPKKKYQSAWGTGKITDQYLQVYIFKIASHEDFELWVAGGKPKRGKVASLPIQVPTTALLPGETNAQATVRLQNLKPLKVGSTIL
jgi:hypothetical protein